MFVGFLLLTFGVQRSIGRGMPALWGGFRFAHDIYDGEEGEKKENGDDHAATTFLSVGDRLVGCAIGNGSDPVGWTYSERKGHPSPGAVRGATQGTESSG